MAGLKTISFIGSDKNAGKTTAFNFYYSKIRQEHKNIILLSIGINGEGIDSLEGHEKPKITASRGNYFVTEMTHLKGLDGRYSIAGIFPPPEFKKVFVLCRATENLSVILEGPNEKSELLKLKQSLGMHFKDGLILLDGSIDRQFIADELVSDEFFFALLLTDRPEQTKKLNNLLRPLGYKKAGKKLFSFIKRSLQEGTKSLLMDSDYNIIYLGAAIPFLDSILEEKLKENSTKDLFLYIDGALTAKLEEKLASFKKLAIILNSFPQELSVNTHEFKTALQNKLLMNKVKIKGIFIKDESTLKTNIQLPDNVPVYNLFREEDLNEIRV